MKITIDTGDCSSLSPQPQDLVNEINRLIQNPNWAFLESDYRQKVTIKYGNVTFANNEVHNKLLAIILLFCNSKNSYVSFKNISSIVALNIYKKEMAKLINLLKSIKHLSNVSVTIN